MPYCNFAMSGFSEMKLNNFRFQVNGRGMMSNMKTLISNTSSKNTWKRIFESEPPFRVERDDAGGKDRNIDERLHFGLFGWLQGGRGSIQ